MRTQDEESFEAFVGERSADLLRTAVLLTDDRVYAEGLVRSALVATYRHWRRISEQGDPYAHARRVMVAAAAGRRRRRQTVQEIVELPAGVGADPWNEDLGEQEAVTREVAALPPRTRAVLVLRYGEDLPEASTAQCLGRSTDTVRTETARGLARLRPLLGAPAAETIATAASPTTDIEQLLRQHFRDRADLVAPPPRDLHRSTLAASRQQRRHRATLVATGLVATLVAGASWGPAVLLSGTPPTGPSEAHRPGDLGIYDVPTRGSLADDATFVAGAASIDWSGEIGVGNTALRPDESTRRVLFAGEVPGGDRWALVMGRVGVQLAYAWFTGPAGAGGTELELASPVERGAPDQPMTLLEASPPRGALVVVSLPGDEVEYSASVDRDASGELVRTFEDLPTVDGVAVASVPTFRSFTAGEVQVIRDDVITHRFAPAHLMRMEPLPVVPLGGGDYEHYGLIVQRCLAERGYAVQVTGDGRGFTYDSAMSTAEDDAFQAAVDECAAAGGFGP